MKSRMLIALAVAGAVFALPLMQAGLGSDPFLDALRRVSVHADTVPMAEAASVPRLPVGELTDKRTQNSKTERKRDGTLTTTVFTSPTNYRDTQGKWQPIDSNLTGSGVKGYRWVNSANSFRSYFKSKLDDDYVRVDVGGSSFSMNLEGAASNPGKVHGNQITYSSILPNVDLHYEIQPQAVKEALVLNAASAPSSYKFLLTTPTNAEIIPSERLTGAWDILVPSHAHPTLTLARPNVQDAPDGNKRSVPQATPAVLTVRKVADGKFELTIGVDSTWLHSPSRRFPVTLDPTIQVQPDTLDETFIYTYGMCQSGQSTDCYSTSSGNFLTIGTDGDPSAYDIYRAGLKFDLGAVPTGATVTTAELDLVADNVISVPNPANSHQIDARLLTSPLGTSVWPQYGTGLSSNFVYTGTPAMKWDVTNAVEGWLSGAAPNYGILLMRDDETPGKGGVEPWSGTYIVDTTKTPKLMINWTDAPVLFQPDTLHSNGAELRWTRYGSPAGSTFQKYEVHRSSTANFTPSASTLLMSTTDIGTTSFRDTTAAPGGTFHYKVLANSSPSQEVTVTLPADGQAVKVLQSGKDTDVVSGGTCAQTDGLSQLIYIGVEAAVGQPIVARGLIGFNLQGIPSSATVQSAVLKVFHPYIASSTAPIRAYRVTRNWSEGTGGCDGASWNQAQPGINWTASGGDFDPQAVATVSYPANEAPTTHQYDLTSLARLWVSGQAPNLGVMLKSDDEVNLGYMAYDSADSLDATVDFPTLTVTYSENVHAIAPTVTVSSPVPGAVVSGSSVSLTAAPADDGYVTQVQFLVDGGLIGTATASPWTVTWDSTRVGNGSHTVTAVATDDAGNLTPSAAVPSVPLTVNNAPPPTTSITSPANNASSLTGTVTVTSSNSASSGLSVSKVELYVDGALYATSTTSPYSFSWNTLDPVLPSYDGSPHSLTTRVYDSSGLVTTSPAVSLTTANTAATEYVAGFSSSAVPPTMSFDPSASTQLTYPVNVTVTNNSSQSWSSASTFLRYRWYSLRPGDPVIDSGNVAALGLIPGANTQVQVQVTPPALPDGVNAEQFRLRFEVFDTSGTSPVAFANRGNPPLDNPVIVNKVLKTKLGLEHFYQYSRLSVGAGMTSMVNVANGNSLLNMMPLSEPGRGLSTFADLTYNSLEEHSESPAGNNWSLSVSSLTRFGKPLDIHPNNADTIAGRSNKFIEFVDATGTLQHFDGVTGSDGVTYWLEPPGVHLYLRSVTTDTTQPQVLGHHATGPVHLLLQLGRLPDLRHRQERQDHLLHADRRPARR